MKVTGAADAPADAAFDADGVDGAPAVVLAVVPVVPVVVVAVVPVVPLAVVVLGLPAALALESIRALVSVNPPSAPLLRQPVTVTSRAALSLPYL